MRSWLAFLRLALLVFSIPIYCHAEPTTYKQEEAVIPKLPSAPPSLKQKEIPNPPHCERYFVYLGKRIECDSNMGNDGERLRPIIQDVPDAVAELNAYQHNLKHIRVAAYLGTAGLLAVVIGGIVSHPLVDPGTGALRPGGFLSIGGAVLAANSLIYSLSLIHSNEVHLKQAVEFHNRAHPDRPLSLEFKTPDLF